MIALIQIADSVVQAESVKAVNLQLLEALRIEPETVAEMYQQATESFARIKSS